MCATVGRGNSLVNTMTISRTFALALLTAATVRAEILPSFDHNQLAEKSDHVVLVTEGDSIDGQLTVLASYKGDIPVGSEISLSSLRVFADRNHRKIEPLFGQAKPWHAEISCRLMILFLNGNRDKLRPSSTDPDWHTWLCWIEDGIVYARWQQVNPGKTSLKEYGRGLGATLATILQDIGQTESQDKPCANDADAKTSTPVGELWKDRLDDIAKQVLLSTEKETGGWSPNKPTGKDVILPRMAVNALLATPWVIKYFHGANPIRLQSRHVPVDAKLEVNKIPVVVDDVLRKPHEDFARFEITAVEEVAILKGYAVSFRYPSEGVVGTVLLVPATDDWRVILFSGAEI